VRSPFPHRRARLTLRSFLHDASSVAYAWYEHALETALAAGAGAARCELRVTRPQGHRLLLVAVR
jgi:hypothetical protein